MRCVCVCVMCVCFRFPPQNLVLTPSQASFCVGCFSISRANLQVLHRPQELCDLKESCGAVRSVFGSDRESSHEQHDESQSGDGSRFAT